jgi:hypothetical protein
MSSLGTLVDAVLQDPLCEAHTAVRAGRRVVGYVGPDIPVELILAAGATPVSVGCLIESATPTANRYLESSFSAGSRALAQQWLTGQLEVLQHLVLPRTDDSLQRLYYYICELQRRGECAGPKPLLYDIASLERPSSIAHSVHATRLLAADLQTEPSALQAAVARVRDRTQGLDRLVALRQQPEPPAGSLVRRALRASGCTWSHTFDAALAAWLDAPTLMQPVCRLVLLGSDPADERIHATVEAAGATVVDEISVNTRARVEMQRSDDLMSDIARRYLQSSTSSRALLRSAATLQARMHSARADAAIVWLTATETGLAWQVPMLLQVLRAANLACLVLTGQPSIPDAGTLEHIAGFVQARRRGS